MALSAVSLRISDSVLESMRLHRKSPDDFRAIRAGHWVRAGSGIRPRRRDGRSPSRRPGGSAAKRWQRRPRRSPVTTWTDPRPTASTGGDRWLAVEHPATGRPPGRFRPRWKWVEHPNRERCRSWVFRGIEAAATLASPFVPTWGSAPFSVKLFPVSRGVATPTGVAMTVDKQDISALAKGSAPSTPNRPRAEGRRGRRQGFAALADRGFPARNWSQEIPHLAERPRLSRFRAKALGEIGTTSGCAGSSCRGVQPLR